MSVDIGQSEAGRSLGMGYVDTMRFAVIPQAFRNILLSLGKGVIIGPSGSGKSTFLRCLNLLETPTSGIITFDGQVITDPRADIDKVRRQMGFARGVADGVLFMYGGKIAESGVPDEIFNSPKNERTQQFLQSIL